MNMNTKQKIEELEFAIELNNKLSSHLEGYKEELEQDKIYGSDHKSKLNGLSKQVSISIQNLTEL